MIVFNMGKIICIMRMTVVEIKDKMVLLKILFPELHRCYAFSLFKEFHKIGCV